MQHHNILKIYIVKIIQRLCCKSILNQGHLIQHIFLVQIFTCLFKDIKQIPINLIILIYYHFFSNV